MYSREDLKICPVSDKSLLSDLTEIFSTETMVEIVQAGADVSESRTDAG